jgi:hypothetical protein
MGTSDPSEHLRQQWCNFLIKMKLKIEIIAGALIASLADIVELTEKEIKDESFRLIFYLKSHSLFFYAPYIT